MRHPTHAGILFTVMLLLGFVTGYGATPVAMAEENLVQDAGAARIAPLAAKGLLLDATRVGQRIVAVGEFGHVVLSDDEGTSWRQAEHVPTRTTLTSVTFASAEQGWAVGHGGLVLVTTDAGLHWRVQFGAADGADSLFSVLFVDALHGVAVGPFGYAISTADGGEHWSKFSVMEGEDGERHLNGLFTGNAGRLLIAAEIGGVFLSDDLGVTWRLVNLPYEGSVWGGTALNDGSLVVWGMAGHALRSVDNGESWQELATATHQSLTDGVELAGGGLALVGLGGVVTVSDSQYVFKATTREDRQLAASVVVVPRGLLLFTAAGIQTFSMGMP
jgi:photosystem II stability/assembly factor-like uncharacterized protein